MKTDLTRMTEAEAKANMAFAYDENGRFLMPSERPSERNRQQLRQWASDYASQRFGALKLINAINNL